MRSRIVIDTANPSVVLAGAAHADRSSRINPDGQGSDAEARADGKTLKDWLHQVRGGRDVSHAARRPVRGNFEGLKNVYDADDSFTTWLETHGAQFDRRALLRPLRTQLAAGLSQSSDAVCSCLGSVGNSVRYDGARNKRGCGSDFACFERIEHAARRGPLVAAVAFTRFYAAAR